MTKCPKCKTESPKQFLSVKTVKKEYQQCKSCGLRIPEEIIIQIGLKALNIVSEKKTFSLQLAQLGILKEKSVTINLSKLDIAKKVEISIPLELKIAKKKTAKLEVNNNEKTKSEAQVS